MAFHHRIVSPNCGRIGRGVRGRGMASGWWATRSAAGCGRGHASPGVIHANPIGVWINRAGWIVRVAHADPQTNGDRIIGSGLRMRSPYDSALAELDQAAFRRLSLPNLAFRKSIWSANIRPLFVSARYSAKFGA